MITHKNWIYASMSSLRLGTFFILFCVFSSIDVSHARMMPSSRSFYGYSFKDRWGQNVFHNGPYHYFLSDKVAVQLEMYRGKPLELDVTETSQLMNPGAGRIEAIKAGAIHGALTNLVFTLKCKSTRVEQGKGLNLQLSFRNVSHKAVELLAGTLAVILTAKDPKDPPHWKGPEDIGYWYFQESWEKNSKHFGLSCHKELMPWTGEDLVKKGHHIRVADKDQEYEGPLIVKPNGSFDADVIVGQELLPGEYEVFFCDVMSRNPNIAGPMSERVGFDVIAPKK